MLSERTPLRGTRDAHILPKVLNRRRYLSDVYFWLLSTSWPLFALAFMVAYLALALCFVGVQALDSRGLAGVSPRFSSLLLLNVNILAGAGGGQPLTTYMEVVLAIEALCQVFIFALITGLFYARFARPTARVRFSKVAVISSRGVDGCAQLSVRVTNERDNWLARADVTCSLIILVDTPDGPMRRILDLELKRSTMPRFNVPWTLMHTIDARSPLFGQTHESLVRCQARITFSIQGTDETQNATIGATIDYGPQTIRCGARFADIFTRNPDGSSFVDLTDFDTTVSESSAEAINV